MSFPNRARLFDHLDRLAIPHRTYEHPPLFTVADGADLKSAIPGASTKNLFLKDRAGRFALISAWADSKIALNRLHRAMGFDRFSFGPPDEMERLLGVSPGAVTAFSLINDPDQAVTFALDAALFQFEEAGFHPLDNCATTIIKVRDLARFVMAAGRPLLVMDFSGQGDPVRMAKPPLAD